jgi:hypothetical protein
VLIVLRQLTLQNIKEEKIYGGSNMNKEIKIREEFIKNMKADGFLGNKKSKYFKLGFDACKEEILFMIKDRRL